MPRAQRGAARRQSKNRWLKHNKGKHGTRNTQWRRAKETAIRAGTYQYFHRKQRKRDYRKLWITRIGAACKQRGLPYNQFIAGLKTADIALNRKMLSEIAIHDPGTFDALVAKARAAHPEAAAA